MGYGDIKFLYDLPADQSISGTLRYNPSTNKGAAQIDYILPGYVVTDQGPTEIRDALSGNILRCAS